MVEYLPDSSIDGALDEELRGLLSLCFTKPGDEVFRTRRFFKEPYPHRWVIRNTKGALIAHAGVHDKVVEAAGRTYRIGGFCEVCVHPDFRGQKFVRAMLDQAATFLAEHDYDFAMLFGHPKVYASSGYVSVSIVYDEVSPNGNRGLKPTTALVKPLGATPWPDGEVHLIGIKF